MGHYRSRTSELTLRVGRQFAWLCSKQIVPSEMIWILNCNLLLTSPLQQEGSLVFITGILETWLPHITTTTTTTTTTMTVLLALQKAFTVWLLSNAWFILLAVCGGELVAFCVILLLWHGGVVLLLWWTSDVTLKARLPPLATTYFLTEKYNATLLLHYFHGNIDLIPLPWVVFWRRSTASDNKQQQKTKQQSSGVVFFSWSIPGTVSTCGTICAMCSRQYTRTWSLAPPRILEYLYRTVQSSGLKQ